MKRFICILIILSLSCLLGCNHQISIVYDSPVYFYYPYEDVDLYDDGNAIDYEIHEGSDFSSDNELIQAYFEGPDRSAFYSPFPPDGTVIDSIVSGNRIRVVLSKHFNELIGMELTMATSCLALTLLDTKGVTIVEIHILSDDGAISRSFFLTRDSVVLTDSYKALPVE